MLRKIRFLKAVNKGRAAAEVMGMLAEQARQRKMGMPTRARAAWELPELM